MLPPRFRVYSGVVSVYSKRRSSQRRKRNVCKRKKRPGWHFLRVMLLPSYKSITEDASVLVPVPIDVLSWDYTNAF
jgi:hypothetical protein